MNLQRKCGSWTEEYQAPSSGRGWKNPVTTPSHQTWFDEELCESQGPDFTVAIRYLNEKIPRLSEAKIKEGVFVGPQIRELFKDDRFNNML